ncbi:MAG: peptidase vanX D-ala-D-ala dipeptidase [Bacteroidetes bacterium]|jgi:D-alanyl-D-alanine dipeptidase|nr:peptidase vanX D-ala-D-ala dipeptidase [Bacteroidota bacterium]
MNNTAKILFLLISCITFFSSTAQPKDLDAYLRSNGLVDIQQVNPAIKVQLAYSTVKNFVNLDMYGKLEKCYLPKEVALALSEAQKKLSAISSHYRLIVFDGTRPLHIQQLMWDSLKLPIEQKTKYLAYPGSISLHNYGAAVDLGLITTDGMIVDMGTSFDFFGPEAHITQEAKLVKEGKLSPEQLINRKLLRKVMLQAGFKTMSTEWWHFNYCTKEEAAAKFMLIK